MNNKEKIERYLEKKYKTYKNMTTEQRKKFKKNLNGKDLYEYNKNYLLINEKKEYSYLKITEPGRIEEKENIFDKYVNILEFANVWKKFQLEHHLNDMETFKIEHPEKYNDILKSYEENELYLHGEWLRYIEKEIMSKDKQTLKYACLISLESYMQDIVSNFFDKELNKKIPNGFFYEYGDTLFKKDTEEDSKYFIMTDPDIRAAGKEKELEIIRNIWNEKGVKKALKIIREEILPYKNMVFRKLKINNDKFEDHLQYDIIGGKEAAEQISFKTYLTDIYKLEQPFRIIKNLKKVIKKRVKKEVIKKIYSKKIN